MGTSFIITAVVCVIIGILAQKLRGRTGAAWALITLVLATPVWWVFYFATAMSGPEALERYSRDSGFEALTIFVMGGIGALMVIVVITLPDRRPPAAAPPAEPPQWQKNIDATRRQDR